MKVVSCNSNISGSAAMSICLVTMPAIVQEDASCYFCVIFTHDYYFPKAQICIMQQYVNETFYQF